MEVLINRGFIWFDFTGEKSFAVLLYGFSPMRVV